MTDRLERCSRPDDDPRQHARAWHHNSIQVESLVGALDKLLWLCCRFAGLAGRHEKRKYLSRNSAVIPAIPGKCRAARKICFGEEAMVRKITWSAAAILAMSSIANASDIHRVIT